MGRSLIRVLVVDDYEPWHDFISKKLREQPELQIIKHVFDGLQAVQEAQRLQPDLIFLDIGLPSLNGIETARRIRDICPGSKILFLSENSSRDIVEAALNAGGQAFVLKSDAATELLPAVNAVRQHRQFVSARFAGVIVTHPALDYADFPSHECVGAQYVVPRADHHEVAFYPDDNRLVDGFTHFIEAALHEQNAVIVVATDSHQASLLQRLAANGLNMPAEIEQGNYIPLEVLKTLSSFIVNDLPDPVLFKKVAGDLITKASRRPNGGPRRVAICGEGVHRLLADGHLDATIALERLWNQMANVYQLDILCGYFQSDFTTEANNSALENVCIEHSDVHGRGY